MVGGTTVFWCHGNTETHLISYWLGNKVTSYHIGCQMNETFHFWKYDEFWYPTSLDLQSLCHVYTRNSKRKALLPTMESTATKPQSLMTMTRCAWSELPVLTDKWHWVKLHSHSIHIHQVSLAFFHRVWEHKTYLGTLVNTITLDTVYDVTWKIDNIWHSPMSPNSCSRVMIVFKCAADLWGHGLVNKTLYKLVDFIMVWVVFTWN